MALVNCKECGKEISTQANRCPSCGAKQRTSGFGVAVMMIGALAIAFLMFGFFLESRPGADEARRAREAFKVCQDMAAQQGTDPHQCDPIIDKFVAKYGRQP